MTIGPDIIGPSSSYYVSQRRRLHFVDWGNEDKPPLLLIHGGRDHARSWDWVARELREEWHVIAPDLRGHGDSAWALGGPYSMLDHVLDLTQLLEMLDEFPAAIVAHSLGGSLCLMYAGLYPENVRKLVAIEGLGPPPQLVEQIRAMDEPAVSPAGGMLSDEDAAAAAALEMDRYREGAAAAPAAAAATAAPTAGGKTVVRLSIMETGKIVEATIELDKKGRIVSLLPALPIDPNGEYRLGPGK